LNLIRQTYISNTNHILKYGISYYADRYTESFPEGHINVPFSDKVRVDLMSGIFSEYAFKIVENFNLVAGIRADYYNNTEEINYLPRINMKYNPTENTAIRFSAGRAFRIANVFVENASFLASSRKITLEKDLNPEIAWNYGTNITYCFRFLGREGTINADAYRTVFSVAADAIPIHKMSTIKIMAFIVLKCFAFWLDLGNFVFESREVEEGYRDSQYTYTKSSQNAKHFKTMKAIILIVLILWMGIASAATEKTVR
jgi:hypothetical protein